MVKFSIANAKLEQLHDCPELESWLAGDREVYSFDLKSGDSCPFAKDCHSRARVRDDGTRYIEDGPDTLFRCFSASQEVQYTNVFNLRTGNWENLRGKTTAEILDILEAAYPPDAGIVRIHVAGDFFSEAYFLAWVEFARRHSATLFYAYTKSLPYWVRNRDIIPPNLILTASRGGRRDSMIDEYGLRESVVVFSEDEARVRGLAIDHDDSHAARPDIAGQSFALLIHGTQPKGSEAAAALQKLRKDKVRHSYSRKRTA